MDSGSNSSSKKRVREAEAAATATLSSSKKPSRNEAAAAAMLTPKPTQLVACFMHLQGYHKVSYSFEFFKIQDLLDYETLPQLVKPTRSLPWPEENNDFTNQIHVSFFHSNVDDGNNGDGDGLGALYAVGGVDSYPFCDLQDIPKTLPNVFTRISLGGGYKMLDAYTTRMNAGKFFPLVAEIDQLIYVLSGPTNLYGPRFKVSYDNFEVYNPRDMSWKLLSDLPFISNDNVYYNSTCFFGYKYSRLVLGQKLFVSDMVVSSVYDIASDTWSACHLFADCHFPPRFNKVPKRFLKHCGPGFPFIGEALLWKGEFLLCMLPENSDPMTVAVYRIEKDENLREKAIPLELRCEGKLFPDGHGSQLVDIGDDHFALIIEEFGEEEEEEEEYQVIEEFGEEEEGYQGTMNIYTFMLETDATNHNRLLVKDLNKRYSKPNHITTSYFLYSFLC